MYEDKPMKRTFLTSRSRWLYIIMLLALAAGPVLAAESGALAVDPNAAPNGVTIDPNQAMIDSDSGLIKFIAFQKDSNIRDGLRLLAVLCKKNIVPSSRVDGLLTVSRLYEVTFEQALAAILGHGFKYKQDGDFVRVYTTEEYNQIREDPERMVHKVITLYYITAEEASKLMQPVLSTAAMIQMSSPAEEMISVGTQIGGGGASLSGGGGGDNLALNDMIVVFDYRGDDFSRTADRDNGVRGGLEPVERCAGHGFSIGYHRPVKTGHADRAVGLCMAGRDSEGTGDRVLL